jgi:catechol 2,3-dioxygenase-like lactoylglutathione lyase family enzyme
MSYVALVTDQFDATVHFYGVDLGLPVVRSWDRPNSRGRVFELNGLRLEILDNGREARPLRLAEPADRFHLVVEVDDVDAVWRRLGTAAPTPRVVSWGARLFQVRDPDGVPVTFLEWLDGEGCQTRPGHRPVADPDEPPGLCP